MAIETGPPLGMPWEEFGWLSLPRAVTKLPPLAGAPGADEALGGLDEQGGRRVQQPPTTGFLTPEAAFAFMQPGGTRDPGLLGLSRQVTDLAQLTQKARGLLGGGGVPDVPLSGGLPHEPAATGTELLQTGVAGELPGGGGAINPAFSGTELLQTGAFGELAGLPAVSGPDLLAAGGVLGEAAPAAGGLAGLGNLLPGLGALGAFGSGIFNLAQGDLGAGVGSLGGLGIGLGIGAALAPETFGLSLLLGGLGGSAGGLLGGLFGGKPSVYDIKRKAASQTAQQDIAGMGAAQQSALAGQIDPLTALNFLSGDISSIPGRNPVRSELLMSPAEAATLGLPAGGSPWPGGAVREPWSAFTPDTFTAFLNAVRGGGSVAPYLQNPTPGAGNAPWTPGAANQFEVLGSGDVAYLPYGQAVGVANQAAQQTVDFLKSLVAQSAAPPAAKPAALPASVAGVGTSGAKTGATTPGAVIGAGGGDLDQLMAQAGATLGLPTG